MTNKKEIKSDFTDTTESFTALYGEGSYSSETITKGEYDRRNERKKVFMHKDKGKRVW